MLAVSLMFFFLPGDVRIIPADDSEKSTEPEAPSKIVSPRRRLEFENLHGVHEKSNGVKEDEEEAVDDKEVYSDLSNIRGDLNSW